MTIFKNKNKYDSETPNKYKLSSLIESIYRANDTCTNESELN